MWISFSDQTFLIPLIDTKVDLLEFIDWSSVECLNQNSSHSLPNALKQVNFFLSDSLLGFGIPFPRILYCFLKLMDSSIYGRGFVRIQDFWWTMMFPEVLRPI